MKGDPNDLEAQVRSVLSLARMKILFGFLLLVAMIALAAVIALGKVTEHESYGLMPIITALATLAGGFSNWAFGHNTGMDIAKQLLDKPPEAPEDEGEQK